MKGIHRPSRKGRIESCSQTKKYLKKTKKNYDDTQTMKKTENQTFLTNEEIVKRDKKKSKKRKDE